LITLLGFYILINKFSYRPRPLIDTVILKNTASFSMANYLVSFLNGLPALLLPIIVTNSLGAKLNSVYYISYSMASLLFIIPLGIGNALFAEGSQSELNLKHIIRRAAYLNAIIMIPSIAFIIVIAPFVFLFFGHQYSIDGIAVLRILALSSLFLAISYPCGSILNIMHRLKSLIIVNFLGATIVICIVEVMIRRKGSLSSVALGWLIGWAIYSLLYIVAVRNAFYKTAVTTR
jgi:O-antigen/teichoic acid export membrane protein